MSKDKLSLFSRSDSKVSQSGIGNRSISSVHLTSLSSIVNRLPSSQEEVQQQKSSSVSNEELQIRLKAYMDSFIESEEKQLSMVREGEKAVKITNDVPKEEKKQKEPSMMAVLAENAQQQAFMEQRAADKKSKMIEEDFYEDQDEAAMYSEGKSSQSPSKKSGKPPIQGKKQRVLRADIISRLGITSQQYKKIPHMDPFINKMLMNDVIPKEVKEITKLADHTFGQQLNVARATRNVDYEDGVYFVMPKDPRGIQLIMLREAAEQKAKSIEAEFANLTTVVTQGSTKATTRTIAQQQTLEKLRGDPQDLIRDAQNQNVFSLNRDQVVVDLRAVKPSSVAVRSITNTHVKGDIQAKMLRDLIEEREKNDRIERNERLFKRTEDLRKQYGVAEVAEQSQNITQTGTFVSKNEQGSPTKNLNQQNTQKTNLDTEQQNSPQKPFLGIPGLKTYNFERQQSVLGSVSENRHQHNSVQISMMSQSNSKLQTKQLPQILTSASAPNLGGPVDKYQEIAASRKVVRLKSLKEETTQGSVNNSESVHSNQLGSQTPKRRNKTPRKINRSPHTRVMHETLFEQHAVLIKPQIDASDKELHMRNNFNHQSKNMQQFIQAAYKDSDFQKQVFKPSKFGQLSKNYQGNIVNVRVPEAKPDFKRVDYGPDGRNLDLPKKPPLPPGTPGTPAVKKKTTLRDSIVAAPLVEIKKPKNDGDWSRVQLTEAVEQSATEASTNASTSISRSKAQGSSFNSGSQDMSRSRASMSGTKSALDIQNHKPKPKLKVVQHNQVGTANFESMKSIIAEVAQKIDVLDKVTAKPGQNFKMLHDLSQEEEDVQSQKSVAKSENSNTYDKVSQLSTSSKLTQGNRIRRDRLQGGSELPQRKRAYLTEKRKVQQFHNAIAVDPSKKSKGLQRRQNAMSNGRTRPVKKEAVTDLQEQIADMSVDTQTSREKEQENELQKEINEFQQKLQDKPLFQRFGDPKDKKSKLEFLRMQSKKDMHKSLSTQNIHAEIPKEPSVKKTKKSTEPEVIKENGLVLNKKYDVVGADENVNLVTSKGIKIAPVRVINQYEVKNMVADQQREEEEFRANIRLSKKKRYLEMAELQMHLDAQAKIKNKRDYDYEREGKKVMYDEIEDALLDKYKDHKDRNYGKKEEDEIKQIPRQALIDNMYIQGWNYHTSVAEFKRVWVGGEGQFKADDLKAWYRIYDSTKVREAKGFLFSKHKDNQKS